MYDYYKELYLLLFNRVTDAVRYLEEGSPGQARRLLKAAQSETQNKYIELYAFAGIED